MIDEYGECGQRELVREDHANTQRQARKALPTWALAYHA